jgi:uncharacterized coiled-coil protein SlyX
MDLVTEPDIYTPSIDETGKYIDKIHGLSANGIRCPCGLRKNAIYDTKIKFKNHINTKSHQQWIDNMNANRSNHLIESIQLNETVKNQRVIIAQLQRNIDRLTNENEALKQNRGFDPTIDLLIFD